MDRNLLLSNLIRIDNAIHYYIMLLNNCDREDYLVFVPGHRKKIYDFLKERKDLINKLMIVDED